MPKQTNGKIALGRSTPLCRIRANQRLTGGVAQQDSGRLSQETGFAPRVKFRAGLVCSEPDVVPALRRYSSSRCLAESTWFGMRHS